MFAGLEIRVAHCCRSSGIVRRLSLFLIAIEPQHLNANSLNILLLPLLLGFSVFFLSPKVFSTPLSDPNMFSSDLSALDFLL